MAIKFKEYPAGNMLIFPSANAVDGGELLKESLITELARVSSNISHVVKNSGSELSVMPFGNRAYINESGTACIGGYLVKFTKPSDPSSYYLEATWSTIYYGLALQFDGTTDNLMSDSYDGTGAAICRACRFFATNNLSDINTPYVLLATVEDDVFSNNEDRFAVIEFSGHETLEIGGDFSVGGNLNLDNGGVICGPVSGLDATLMPGSLTLTDIGSVNNTTSSKIDLNKTGSPAHITISTDTPTPTDATPIGINVKTTSANKDTLITGDGITIHSSVGDPAKENKASISSTEIELDTVGEFGNIKLSAESGIRVNGKSIDVQNQSSSSSLTPASLISNRHDVNMAIDRDNYETIKMGTPVSITSDGVVGSSNRNTFVGVSTVEANENTRSIPVAINGIVKSKILISSSTISAGDILIPSGGTSNGYYFTKPSSAADRKDGGCVMALQDFEETADSVSTATEIGNLFGISDIATSALSTEYSYQVIVSDGYATEISNLDTGGNLSRRATLDTDATTRPTFPFNFNNNVIKNISSGNHSYVYGAGMWYDLHTGEVLCVVRQGSNYWMTEFENKTGVMFGTREDPEIYVPELEDVIAYDIGKVDTSEITDGVWVIHYDDSQTNPWIYKNYSSDSQDFALIKTLVLL